MKADEASERRKKPVRAKPTTSRRISTSSRLRVAGAGKSKEEPFVVRGSVVETPEGFKLRF